MKFRRRGPLLSPLRAVRLAAIGIGMAVLFSVGGASEMMQAMWEVGKAGIIVYKETAEQTPPQPETAGSQK